MQQRFGLLNGGNAFLKISFVGIVNEKFYSFNKPKYAPTDAEIQLTTKKELLDLYFEYEGKRLVSTDRVPYNSKTPTKVKMVARTRNMIGEEIKFTAHALEDNSILENLGESKIKENGIAVLNFLKKAPTDLKKDGTETYYAGVEGFSTKHIKDKTLVFKVGAKWDTNTILHSMTWGNRVNNAFREKVIEICMDIWGHQDNLPQMVNGLMAVMYRETAGTFATHQIEGIELKNVSELTKNDFTRFDKKTGKVNGSRAVGLIQFTQDALEQMHEFKGGDGYDKLHTIKLNYAKMNKIEQLEKVKKYFNMCPKKPQVPEDIYATVFAPKTVGLKISTTMYKKGTEEYIANPGLDKNGNGIQKNELLTEYYESLTEGNKSGNIAVVTIKIEKSICDNKCINYSDVVDSPKINNQSNNVNKNRWHRDKRKNSSYPKGYFHTGTDILAKTGTVVKSMLCGTVYDLKDTFSTNEYEVNSLGNYIIIKSKDKDGNDIFIKHCHLDKVNVIKNQKVKHGDPIAKAGSTGNAA